MSLRPTPSTPLLPLDLSAPAQNGLRRGFTTGTCAAAAAKAAVTLLLRGELPPSARVALPDGLHFLDVPIIPVAQSPGWAAASVIKDAGDDPDQTHRARIIVRARINATSRAVRLLRGEGVGVVTRPGLRLAVGEPAINAVPRAMILAAVCDALETDEPALGLDIEVGCENGAEIAKRTFNPRLGIADGISILGTTGIVEPKSLASFMASIEVYVRVALADGPSQVVLSPGNLGQRFARASLQLPVHRIVQVSNFVGFALESVSRSLAEIQARLPLLWLVGHPGKLAKIILGEWDTHSKNNVSALSALYPIAQRVAPSLVPHVRDSDSTEALIETSAGHPDSTAFWHAVEEAIALAAAKNLRGVDAVQTRLFSMSAVPLGGSS